MYRTFTMSALKALRALGIAVLVSGCSALNANNRKPKFRVCLASANLAPSLLRALRKVPKTTRNLNGQTTAQLAGEHDNLPAMMTFMCDEIR
jgi:hypothetical protein